MDHSDVEWHLAGTPRPVQLEALLRSFYGYRSMDVRGHPYPPVKLRNSGPARGWGHLMEMRLGKTPTIMNEIALLFSMDQIDVGIIFSPNTYKGTWVLESQEFQSPIPYWALQADKIDQAEFFMKKNSQCVFVINYEALIQEHVQKFVANIVENKRAYVASDESIKLKNKDSLISMVAREVSKDCRFRRIATGLPITQGPHDFWAQLRFIGAIEGFNYFAFRGKFCKMGGFKGKAVKGVKDPEKLRLLVDPWAFVAKRLEWGSFKEPEFSIERVPLTEKQAAFYEDMEKDFIVLLEDGSEASAELIISKLQKLQQISSGFVINDEGDVHRIMDPSKTSKMKRLLEILEDESNYKVAVIYHYQESGRILREALKKYKPAVIAGQTQMKELGLDYDAEKKRFNSDPSCRIVLGQTTATKYGHTLVGEPGDRAQVMFFYENTFSLDDRTQVEARITMDHQDWPNLYVDFVSSDVEMLAIQALARKESVVTAVLGNYRRKGDRYGR